MSTKNDPAFPLIQDGSWCNQGISKLEYFVGQALASSGWSMMSEETVAKNLATWCYEIAEAIIAEGEKRK